MEFSGSPLLVYKCISVLLIFAGCLPTALQVCVLAVVTITTVIRSICSTKIVRSRVGTFPLGPAPIFTVITKGKIKATDPSTVFIKVMEDLKHLKAFFMAPQNPLDGGRLRVTTDTDPPMDGLYTKSSKF